MSVEIENREAEPTLECAPEPQAAPEEDSDTISKQIHHSSGQDVASNSESVTKQGVGANNESQTRGRVECKASDVYASSSVSSHSSASSHHSTHCSTVTSLRGVANILGGSRSGKSRHSGGGSVESGGGGSAVTSLDLVEFDVLRFRNNFLQTVEELKMRRDTDVKKEKRIGELVEEKHQIQQKCDDIEHGYTEHLEQCSHHEQEIRKQFNNQIRQFEEDKARHACLDESRHKEVKALKDEIRALQLAKYNVEKKVEDQERQLQVHSLSRESILSEMSGVEGKYQTAMSQVASTTDQMTQLEANVKQAIELNRKLRYVNEHQKCVLADYKTELETCRQQLVEARVSLADILAERGEREERTGRKTKTTEQELKMLTELNKQLETQLSGVREEHQAVLDRLKEAHSLLDKHVETSNKAQKSEWKLKEETESLLKRNERLETDLSALQEQLTSLKQELTTSTKKWQTKTADVEQRLKILQGDYSSLQNAHDQQEEEVAARESKLKSEIARLEEREKQRVEKKEGGDRTEREWQERITELEEALETHLQEKSKLFENKEVQVSIATSLGSPPLNSASQQELKTSKESWATVSPITPHTAIVPTITPSTATVPTITTSTATVLPVTRHSPQSIGYLTTDTRTMNTDVKVPTSSQTCAVDCKVEERRAVGGVLGVPSPPKSSFLSPEVISDSSSISPEDKLSREPADEVQNTSALKLPSPRLYLERIQLPLIKAAGAQNISDKSGDSSSGVTSVSKQQHVSAAEDPSQLETGPVSRQSPKDALRAASPLKRKVKEQQSHSPAKKQKLLSTISEAVLPTSKASDSSRSTGSAVLNTSLETLSQPDRIPDRHSFLTLSQPSYHDKVDKEDSQSLSQPSDCLPKKGNIPWRIDLPKSFYMSRTPRTLVSSRVTAAQSMERTSTLAPDSCSTESATRKTHSSLIPQHPSALPSSHYKLPWNFALKPLSKNILTIDTISRATTKSPVQSTITSPMPTNSTITKVNNLLAPTDAELPTITPTKSSPASTSPSGQNNDRSAIYMSKESITDQSVPDSPRGSNNFAIVFSEGEDEADGGEEKGLLNSQMNRQIKKVKTFLKMDRLRRTKMPKM